MSTGHVAGVEVVEADLTDPAQAGAFIALMDGFARDPMGGGKPLPETTREQLVDAILAREHVHVLLAYLDGRAVGFATCIEAFSSHAARSVLNVHDLMVEAGTRGTGVGRRLLEAVESLARRLGACKLTLEVLTGNARAQAVYRAFGFTGYSLDSELGHAVFIQKPLT